MSTHAPARGRADGARRSNNSDRRSSGNFRPRRRSGNGGGYSAPQQRQPKAPSALELALNESAALPVPEAGFADLGLAPAVVARLAEQGITTPTEVQVRTMPDALAGRDILARAQTGSGKTLGFGLPMLTRLAAEDRPTTPRHPRALVLAPTRELAQQVADSLTGVGRAQGLSVLAIYGGTSMDRQVKALQRGVDIVVATPGRLEDHMRRGTCALNRVGTIVLDEADHMADLGFLPAVTRVLEAVPQNCQRLLFSATLDRGVEQLALDHLRDPAVHAASLKMGSVDTMEHRAFAVTHEEKLEVAARVAGRHGRTLMFVRTKHGADRLAKQLAREGIATEAIHGNRSQAQRQRALAEFASGRRPVLIATDVAARGIHVDGVDLVVHFDPPADHKDYLHRSGRTARAGRDGLVLSLLLPHEKGHHRSLHKHTQVDNELVTVDPQHPAVHEIASGGTPIEVIPAKDEPRSPRGDNGGNRSGARRRNGNSGGYRGNRGR